MHLTLDMLMEKVKLDQHISERIQLGGSTVVPGSILWDKYKSRATFTITDGEHDLIIRYVGNALLPDTFKDNALVVLEGKYNSFSHTEIPQNRNFTNIEELENAIKANE